MDNPEYGRVRETRVIDEVGSTVTIERNYVNGKSIKPVRRHYEYRVKVKDKKEEMTEYLKFSDNLTPEKLDPGFRIETTAHGNDNGYYFVIKAYTTLDYADQDIVF